MVQKAAAGAGIALIFVGIALTVVISIIQEWVVVTLPPYESCEEQKLGRLGLFQSTFDPECTQADDVDAVNKAKFGKFEKKEGPTTEFWPLFSSQTGFNGFFDTDAGKVEFTTCEEMFKEGGAAMTQAQLGTAAVVEDLKGSLAQNLAAKYDETAAALREAIHVKAAGVVNGLWAVGATESFSQSFILGLKNAEVNGITGLDTVVLTVWGGVKSLLEAVIDSVDPNTVAFAFTNARDGLTITNHSVGEATLFGALFSSQHIESATQHTSIVDLIADINITTCAGTAASNGFATLTPTVLGQAKAFAGLVKQANLCQVGSPTGTYLLCPMGGLFGQTNGTAALAWDLREAAAWITALEASNTALTGAKTLVNFCIGLGAFTGGACAAAGPGIPETLAVPDTYSTLLAEGVALTWYQLLMAKQGELAANPLLTQAEKDQFTVLFGAFGGCAAAPASFPNTTTCIEHMLASTGGDDPARKGFPTSLAEDYGLCLAIDLVAGASVCTGFDDFLALAKASEPSLDLFDTAVQGCLEKGLPDNTPVDTCLGAAGLSPETRNIFIGFFLDGNTTEQFIKECKDDVEDARRIELAQVLIPVAIGVEVLAIVLAVVAVKLDKAPAAFVGAVLCVAAVGMVVYALIMVKTAPVYSKLDAPKEDKVEFYQAGLAETLAYVCIAAPVIGAILLAVAGCTGGSDSETAVSGKVDAY